MNTTHPLVFILMNSTEGLVFVLMNSTEGLELYVWLIPAVAAALKRSSPPSLDAF